MKLTTTIVAHFLAVQAGAFVVCIGIMLVDMGPKYSDLLKGVGLWIMAQPAVIPIALVGAPVGALLRMVAAMLGGHPQPMALIFGVTVAVLGWLVIVVPSDDGTDTKAWFLLVAVCAGATGGFVWYLFEKPTVEDRIQ